MRDRNPLFVRFATLDVNLSDFEEDYRATSAAEGE